jgi:integrase
MQFFRRSGQTLYMRKRVPSRYKDVEQRESVWISLHTDSETVAKAKAPRIWADMIEAWEAMLDGMSSEGEKRMKAARELAAKRGFRFMSVSEVANLPFPQVFERMKAVENRDGTPNMALAAAILGGAAHSELTVTGALKRFWIVAKVQTRQKSTDQIRRWENPRKKAVANFIEAMGQDMQIKEITTRDLYTFRAWWVEKMDAEGLTANSANKDFVHLTAVIKEVARAEEVALRFNTVGLSIKDGEKGTRPPFSIEWIKDKLLAKGALDGLNSEARGILLGMVNTGYRPSEGAMLGHDQIKLDHNVPHLSIEPVGRQLKSANARRVIPLVGISLEAFRANPDGFPRYADNPGLSDTVNKFLRENKLLESDKHTMYSLRHSFEDRLLATGTDERIRRDLMGHRLTRERYGKGADLVQLQRVLQAIAV